MGTAARDSSAQVEPIPKPLQRWIQTQPNQHYLGKFAQVQTLCCHQGDTKARPKAPPHQQAPLGQGKPLLSPAALGVQCCPLLVFTSLLPAEQSPCCKHRPSKCSKDIWSNPRLQQGSFSFMLRSLSNGSRDSRERSSEYQLYLVSSQLIFNTQAKTRAPRVASSRKGRHSLVTRQLLSYKGLTHSDGKWAGFSSTPRNNSKGPESSVNPSGCKWTPIKERECAALLSHLQGLLP